MSLQWNVDVPTVEVVETDQQAAELLRLALRKVELDPKDFIGWDTETHGKKIPIKSKPLDWMTDTVTFWSLSFATDESGEREYRRWCIKGEYFFYFYPLLENPGFNIAGWNLKYDAHIAYNCGVNIWNARMPVDGLALAQTHDENRRSHGLKSCAKDWCGLAMTPYKSLFDGVRDAQGEKVKEFETSLLELWDLGHKDKVADYASYDAYAHLRTVEWLIDHVRKVPIGSDGHNLWEYFKDTEVPFTELLWRMERRGMYFDIDEMKRKLPDIEGRITEIEQDIARLAGRPININSPKQIAAFMFLDPKGLKLTPVKMTATNQPSTDEEVMEALVEAGVDVAAKIVEARKLGKTKSTYIDALIALCEHFGDHRIHPSFNQLGARTGRLSTQHPNCLDGETEVLTKGGWIKFKELSETLEEYRADDDVDWDPLEDFLFAQWYPDSGKIGFQHAEEFIEENYQGKMVHVENQHIDLLMTPNHRCPLVNRKTGDLKVVPAEDYKEDMKQLHAGQYNRGDHLAIQGFTKNHVGFLIAVQADGSWHDGGIDFGFNKERKSERLKEFLDALEIPYSFGENKGTAKYRFRVKACDHVEWSRRVLGERKLFGEWIVMLSKEVLDFFCSEIFFWDGHWNSKSMYSSNIRHNVDWVQTALVLCGKRTKVREYHYSTSSGERRINYQIDVTHRDHSLTTNVSKSTVPWDGKVYCLTVPTGFIVVRRNGKVCITGNSQNFPRPGSDEWGIRRAFTAPPGYKLIVADYEQIEMRIMAHMSGDERMLRTIRDGKDLHSFTVSAMDPEITYEEVVAAKKSKKPDDRQKFLLDKRQANKAVGFGIIYGAGPPKIATSIPISEADWQNKVEEMDERKFNRRLNNLMKKNPLLTDDQAIELLGRQSFAAQKIQEYFGVFPGVKGFMDYTPQACRHTMYYDEDNAERVWDFKQRTIGAKDLSTSGHDKPFGYVRTLSGRLRRLQDIDAKKYFYKSEAERQSVNTRIQGSAADITKVAMLRIEFDYRLRQLGVAILNQVHDEIVMQVPEENADVAAPIIQHLMEHPFGDSPEDEALCVPIPVDLKIVDCWADAK